MNHWEWRVAPVIKYCCERGGAQARPHKVRLSIGVLLSFCLFGLAGNAASGAPIVTARYTVSDLGPGDAVGLGRDGQVLMRPLPPIKELSGSIGGGGMGPSPAPSINSLPRSALWEGHWMTMIPEIDATAISPQGLIVGTGFTLRACLRYKGRLRDIDTLGGLQNTALGVNDAGHIVGQSEVLPGSDVYHAFLWTAGKTQDLGVLPGDALSLATGINNAGRIAGRSIAHGGAESHAVVWDNGKIHYIGSLGGPNSAANALNQAGQVVGAADTRVKAPNGAFIQHAFLWDGKTMRDLGGITGASSTALGINNRGQIVGTSYAADGYGHATLWENGRAVDLNDLLGLSTLWGLEQASAINDRGEILCQGVLVDSLHRPVDPRDTSHVLLLTPVPSQLP